MAYLLQVDFPHDGIFGEEFLKAFVDLANVQLMKMDYYGKFGLKMKLQKKQEEFIYFQMNLMQKDIQKNIQLDLKVLDIKI